VSEEFSSDPMSWHEVVGCDMMCDGLGRRNTSVLFRKGGWWAEASWEGKMRIVDEGGGMMGSEFS
jgi:hypothetical protein